MKNNRIVKTVAILSGVILLTGCAAATNPVTLFFNETETTMSATQDFNEGQSLIYARTALEALDEENTIEAKLTSIFASRDNILFRQAMIRELRPELEDNMALLRGLGEQAKNQQIALTLEERAWLIEQRIALRDLRHAIKATAGLVYRAISELEGHYSVENIDLILTTFAVASANMDIRAASVVSINAIIIEVIDFLTSKVG